MRTGGVVAVLGTGPGSGKTSLVVGLCRFLSNAGLRVAPFKALTVVQIDERLAASDARWHAAQHHAGAARFDEVDLSHPFVFVTAGSGGAGVLHGPRGVIGPSRLDTADTVDLTPFNAGALRAVVSESLQALAARYDRVIIEGAGSPSDGDPTSDLANDGAWLAVRCPIVLAARLARGGAAASLIGTHASLTPMMRRSAKSFVLMEVGGQQHLERVCASVRRATGMACLGAVPHLTAWDGEPVTFPGIDEGYEIWADAVARYVDRSAHTVLCAP